MSMKVEIWSDVVCPWCYIGKRRFEKALAQFPQRDQVELVWRSFASTPLPPLSPSGPASTRQLAAKYGRSLAEIDAMHDRRPRPPPPRDSRTGSTSTAPATALTRTGCCTWRWLTAYRTS